MVFLFFVQSKQALEPLFSILCLSLPPPNRTGIFSSSEVPTIARIGETNLMVNKDNPGPQIFGISSIYTHPRYDGVTYYNDIALLLLNGSVEWVKAHTCNFLYLLNIFYFPQQIHGIRASHKIVDTVRPAARHSLRYGLWRHLICTRTHTTTHRFQFDNRWQRWLQSAAATVGWSATWHNWESSLCAGFCNATRHLSGADEKIFKCMNS